MQGSEDLARGAALWLRAASKLPLQIHLIPGCETFNSDPRGVILV
jgi:hypothetical protein